MDVDVGIPAWGLSPYLAAAIDSVRRQTHAAWRLQVSQDGSAEPAVQAMLAAREDPRISYSATGRAIGAARNKTRLLRSGDARYVTLLDQDDLWEPDFLRRRVEFLDAHPACAFVFSPLTVVDAGGRVVERAPPLLPDGVHVSAEIAPALLESSGIPGGSVVVRRSALQAVGDELCDFLPRTYDYELWMRLALRFPVGYIHSRDVLWRRHSANASRADLGSYEAEYARLVRHLTAMFARERPDLRPGAAAWRRKLAGLLLMTSIDALSLGDRRTALRYLALAIRRGRRDALDLRTLAVATKVGLGRPGAAVVALAGAVRRTYSGRGEGWRLSSEHATVRPRSRLRRAARKLVRDPAGFADLARDRLARNARAAIADPVESLIMLRERVADRKEVRGKRLMGGGVMPWPPCPYEVDESWEPRMHELVGAPWPCPEQDDFARLWAEVMSELEAGKGIALGRGAFAGWGDGEPGLVRAVWCLTRHLHPEKVVETGVARGITTRFLLEALTRNGSGHLWSIDLPPPLDRELHPQIAIAVPDALRGRWSYVRGSSRRRLPSLLDRVRPVDLFIHDSTHTARNLLFELRHAWDALALGGAVVADDVDLNCGFHTFAREHPDDPALVCHAEPLRPDPPRQDQRGVFAVVRKSGVSW